MNQFNILSPDGFPISPDNFDSRKEANAYFEIWKKRFDRQGYYSTAGRRRIPLDEIQYYCKMVTLGPKIEEI